jgi:hypothetical protein
MQICTKCRKPNRSLWAGSGLTATGAARLGGLGAKAAAKSLMGTGEQTEGLKA